MLSKRNLCRYATIPHPLLSLDVAEVCLIVKDHLGEGHKEAKKKVAEMEKCGVAKVLGISKLRNNYKPHEVGAVQVESSLPYP